MAAAPAAPRIFVSYARSDGKEFAAELRRRLTEEHGFPLWQDLADMEGGRDWWQQITAAIDRVEFLILVMTAAALSSEYVQREWRYARQQGRCVIPVIGAPDIDFAALPGWMRRAHFVDPAEPDQWRRFVRTLEAPCRATRAPFMVENLPEVFVRRPRELEQLVASRSARAAPSPRTAGMSLPAMAQDRSTCSRSCFEGGRWQSDLAVSVYGQISASAGTTECSAWNLGKNSSDVLIFLAWKQRLPGSTIRVTAGTRGRSDVGDSGLAAPPGRRAPLLSAKTKRT